MLVSIFNWLAIRTDIVDLQNRQTVLSSVQWGLKKLYLRCSLPFLLKDQIFSLFLLLNVQSWPHMYPQPKYAIPRHMLLYFSPLTEFLYPLKLPLLASITSPSRPPLPCVAPLKREGKPLKYSGQISQNTNKNSGQWQ